MTDRRDHFDIDRYLKPRIGDNPDPTQWVTCPNCGEEQADMGRNVACESCGDLMPYHDEEGQVIAP